MFLQEHHINYIFLFYLREVDCHIIEEKSSITFETLLANCLM